MDNTWHFQVGYLAESIVACGKFRQLTSVGDYPSLKAFAWARVPYCYSPRVLPACGR